MKEIQGKSILVRVSEGSSYRESTVSQTRAVGVDVNSDPENDLYHFAWLKKYYQILRTVPCCLVPKYTMCNIATTITISLRCPPVLFRVQ